MSRIIVETCDYLEESFVAYLTSQKQVRVEKLNDDLFDKRYLVSGETTPIIENMRNRPSFGFLYKLEIL